MAEPEPKPDPEPEPKPDPPKPEGNVEDLPEWARAAITKANSEAAAHRVKVKELEPLAAKAKELEEAGKTESEKLTEKATAAEQRAADAEARALRLEVAHDKGLTPAQAKRLVGATREELEADADELLSSFKSDEKEKPKPTGRPRERLRGGGDPTEEPEENDPRKLAERIPRR